MKMSCVPLKPPPPPSQGGLVEQHPLDRLTVCPVAQQLFSSSVNWQPGLLVWGWGWGMWGCGLFVQTVIILSIFLYCFTPPMFFIRLFSMFCFWLQNNTILLKIRGYRDKKKKHARAALNTVLGVRRRWRTRFLFPDLHFTHCLCFGCHISGLP